MKTISRRGKGIIWAGLKNPAGDRTRNISLAAIRDLLSADIFRPFFCASKKTGGKWAGLNKSLIEARDNYYCKSITWREITGRLSAAGPGEINRNETKSSCILFYK